MTIGKRPFDGRTHAVIFNSILTGIAIPPSQFRERVPQDLERILDKALAKNRDERCQSAAEVKCDLVRLQRDIESGMAKAATGDSVRRRGNRLGIAIASSVVLVAAAVVFGFFLSKRKGPSSSGLSRQTTVSVLPFQNAAHDAKFDYLATALPDEVITMLSYAPTLSVRPFGMSQRFVWTPICRPTALCPTFIKRTCPKRARKSIALRESSPLSCWDIFFCAKEKWRMLYPS